MAMRRQHAENLLAAFEELILAGRRQNTTKATESVREVILDAMTSEDVMPQVWTYDLKTNELAKEVGA